MADRIAPTTPGQRWTAGLALAFALLVLLFGLPTRSVVVPASTAATPDRPIAAPAPVPMADDGRRTVTTPELGTPVPVAPPPAPREPDPRPESGQRQAPAAPADTSPPVPDSPAGPAFPGIAALVRAGESSLPGRGDREMAEAYLATAAFDAEVVEYGAGPADHADVCDRVGGQVVLAGPPLPRELRDCLVSAGSTVVSYDDRGTSGGASSERTGGSAVSTHRGVGTALLRAAAWGVESGALAGRVGIAASPDLEPEVATVLEPLAAAGLDVAAVAYVEDVPASVSAFREAGVEVTVFALPVEAQRQWVTLDTVLGSGVSYVVVDAADAITDERYPPGFDGARAFTSLLLPWHPETELQASCRSRWEQAGTTTLGTPELVRAFTWCLNVRLLSGAVPALRAGEPLVDLLADLEVASPLTSRLGPLPGGDWGPVQDHVLVWRATCGCWQPVT